MSNSVDMVKNSFIANINLLVHKLDLLLELNIKFSDDDIQRLVEISKLNLGILIEDMEKGDASIIAALVKNMAELKDLLSKYPDYVKYGEYFSVIVKNLSMLQVINDSLPKLINDTKSIYNSLDMLQAIYDNLDTLPDDLKAIQEAAELAQNAANELKTLSIAVDDAPYGTVASGKYNAATGMLTLKVPQGLQGVPGEIGIGINIKDTLPNISSLPTTGSKGDAYLISNNLYVWLTDATKWENVGPIGLGSLPIGSQTISGILRLTADTEFLVSNNSQPPTAGQVLTKINATNSKVSTLEGTLSGYGTRIVSVELASGANSVLITGHETRIKAVETIIGDVNKALEEIIG